ncbi:translin-associated protein X [Callospermophilus lateralis]|uniref:translin-associated protein X n=1 Tax=Callospermophilus lateralis TaxID=76772 RepID=UPI0040385DBA
MAGSLGAKAPAGSGCHRRLRSTAGPAHQPRVLADHVTGYMLGRLGIVVSQVSATDPPVGTKRRKTTMPRMPRADSLARFRCAWPSRVVWLPRRHLSCLVDRCAGAVLRSAACSLRASQRRRPDLSGKEGPGGFRKRKHDNFPHGQRREGKDVSASSPVMLAFKSFQQELDARHDKYERLVKLSRDITVESKRTIFLLHRITSAPDMEEILTESEVKLDGVRQKILQVAQELSGEDMHQFHRAITTGLQEYVEAVSFQHFIKTRSLISMDEINKELVFTTEDSGKENKTPSLDAQDKHLVTWKLKVTPVDYLLGVADLTGELMRMCINSVGNGDIDTPFEVSQFLRQVYDGFSFMGNTGPYEVSKKLYTLKQSLAKVENACYALKVRGSEIPKHMLADVFSVKTEMPDQEKGIS